MNNFARNACAKAVEHDNGSTLVGAMICAQLTLVAASWLAIGVNIVPATLALAAPLCLLDAVVRIARGKSPALSLTAFAAFAAGFVYSFSLYA